MPGKDKIMASCGRQCDRMTVKGEPVMFPTYDMETVVLFDRWNKENVKVNLGVREYKGLPYPGSEIIIGRTNYRVQECNAPPKLDQRMAALK
jgi:hypothetical protein